MKVYLYYIDRELYAFTTNKVFKEEFEYQRNMKCFIKRVERMMDPVFQAFSYKERNKMMTQIPLSDDTQEYFMVIGTPQEEFLLEEKLSDIDKEVTEILSYLKEIPFKKKCRKAIESISILSELRKVCPRLPESVEESKFDNVSAVNCLSLFYDLFKNTFETEESED